MTISGCAGSLARDESAAGSPPARRVAGAPDLSAPAGEGTDGASQKDGTTEKGEGGPSPPSAVVERGPATEAAARVLDVLARVEHGMRETKYEHATRIDERQGIYRWDCSSMAEWVLRRAAPKARRAVAGQRPLARDFFDAISKSPSETTRRGWLRIDRPEQIAKGDVFAWRKPPMFRNRNNTGHVGFVVTTPAASPDIAGVWLVRVADATRMMHGDDSRSEGVDGGYGTGVIAFLFDETGAAVAYGWYGKGQDPTTFVPTTIAFGRVTE
jgi:hypothetical protein